MPKLCIILLDNTLKKSKKFMVHMSDRLFYSGSYARGDFRPDSVIDIMILVDMSDIELNLMVRSFPI